MQVINKFFGGKLHVTNNSKHVNTDHQIDLTKNFPFHDKKSITVNSYHNNIIKQDILGDELEPFAISPKDETIEGFFHKKFPIVGVMWHPERDPDSNNKVILSAVLKNKNFWKNQL